MRKVSIHIKGKVQGVFFRKHTHETALRLSILGFVKNEKDGSVYIEAVAEDEKLNAFIEWCRQGPSRAKVSSVEVSDLSSEGIFTSFQIRK